MSRGERAAIRFVRNFLPNRLLTVLEGPEHPAFQRVITACRRDMRLPASDRSFAVKRLIAAFPDTQRHALTQLLAEVLDVEFDRRRAHGRATFRVGVVAGRCQVAAERRKAGAR